METCAFFHNKSQLNSCLFYAFSVGTFKTKGKDLVQSVLDAALKAGYTSVGNELEHATLCKVCLKNKN